MKKSDLKTGMKVVLRNGEEYLLLLNTEEVLGTYNILIPLCENNSGWLSFDSYNEDLTCEDGYNEYDIMKVFTPYCIWTLLYDSFWDKVWERKDKKKMTIEDIEKELGYEITIVKEKENK